MLEDFTPQGIIKFAAATEDMGERTYTKLAEKFADQKEISEAFSILARDERAHRAQFESLLDKVPPEDDVMTSEERHRYLCAMAKSEFFRGEAGVTTTLDSLKTTEQALAHSLNFEKATLGFYRAVQETLGPEETLEAIIQAEKGHIARLMKLILTDETMKSLGDSY